MEVKAGMMHMEKDSKKVVASKRKGLIILKKVTQALGAFDYHSHEQSQDLLHFIWQNRTTGQIEHDLILLPGDADFNRVRSDGWVLYDYFLIVV